MADYNSIHTGAEIDAAVSKVPTLTPFGNRNILIDGEVGRINQRGFDGNWANVTAGAALAKDRYGYDIWEKETSGTIRQTVEYGNFVPGEEYILTGTGVTTAILTSPSSGNWVIGGIPDTATFVQVERGSIATEFEVLPYNDQLLRVQRYYVNNGGGISQTSQDTFTAIHNVSNRLFPNIPFPVKMISIPTVVIGTYSRGTNYVSQYNGVSIYPTVSSVNKTTKESLGLFIECSALIVEMAYTFNYSADARL